MKYKTLADLKRAIDSGEVPKEWRITLDNDSTTMYEEIFGEKIFDGDTPACLLEQALDLLGIPHESV